MAKNQKEKKENPLVSGIVFLVVGILAVAFGADYVWVLFNVIRIPLQIVGAVVGLVGLVSIITAVIEKKKKQENTPEE